MNRTKRKSLAGAGLAIALVVAPLTATAAVAAEREPAAPTNAGVSEITSTSALINWDLAVPTDEVKSYNVYVVSEETNLLTGKPTFTQDNLKVGDLNSTNLRLKDLPVNTELDVTVNSINDAGVSSPTELTFSTTVVPTAITQPVGLTLAVNEDNTITANWLANSDDQIVSEYVVRYVSATGAIKDVRTKDLTATISGLEASTEYEVFVSAVNELGRSNEASGIVATLAAVIAPVTPEETTVPSPEPTQEPTNEVVPVENEVVENDTPINTFAARGTKETDAGTSPGNLTTSAVDPNLTCDELAAQGISNIPLGSDGYNTTRDRDLDKVACDSEDGSTVAIDSNADANSNGQVAEAPENSQATTTPVAGAIDPNATCKELATQGLSDFKEGEDGYTKARDRDKNGIACDSKDGANKDLAYTGTENVLPLGLLAGLMLVVGSGLLVARRRV